MGTEDTTQELPRAIVDLEDRVASLEKKFQERGYDTRPMFQAHEERISLLEKAIELLRGSPELAKMTFAYQMYWAEGDKVPYCPHCYEDKKQRLHLQAGPIPGSIGAQNAKIGLRIQESRMMTPILSQ